MAEYVLRINGTPTPTSGPNAKATLESVRVAYEEPRVLRFQWLGGSRIMHSEVELLVNGTVRFAGRVLDRQVRPDFSGNDLVTAYGYEELAGDLSITDTLTSYPLLGFPNTEMREILERIITQSLGPELTALGVRAEFVGATDEKIPDLALRGMGLSDALSVLTDSMPGFAWLIDPATKVFQIVNVANSPPYTVTLGRDVVGAASFALTESIRRRYTAVRLIGTSEHTLVEQAAPLEKAWDEGLEATWTKQAATAREQSTSGEPSPMSYVYRRFSFADVAGEIVQSEPVRLMVPTEDASGSTRYHSVKIAYIDYANGYVWAEQPVLKAAKANRATPANAHVPGKAQGVPTAYLVYKTAGPNVVPGIRVPATGFTGTANSLYSIQREKVIYEASNSAVDARRALRLLDVAKDVEVIGRLTLFGDVPEQLWNLNARINIAREGGVTGFENCRAILRAFEHHFRAGQTVLELGTDKGPFLGEVAS